MRRPILLAGAFVAASAAATAAFLVPAEAATGPSAAALALARQPLPANDGWASEGTGVTGGAAADAAHVFVVSDRDALVAAVAGDAPKIVFVS